MKQAIHTPAAPAAIGPYSQAVRTSSFLFLSGQLGIDAATGTLVPEKEAQFEQLFKNIGHVLKEAGCGFEDVVKTTAFVMDMADFAAFNAIYARYFPQPYPARSVVQVAGLPKTGAYAEMEVIAHCPPAQTTDRL